MDQRISAYTTTVDFALHLHRRVGHPSSQHFSFICTSCNSSKVKNELDKCDVCFRAESTRNVFPLGENKADDLFILIHCDL